MGTGEQEGLPKEGAEKWGDKKSDFMTLLMTSWLLQKCGPYMCREGPVLTNAVHTHMHNTHAHTTDTHKCCVCTHVHTPQT